MCHLSCLTCVGQSFTGCLTCKGSNVLYQSSCYCLYPWSDDCTSEASFQGIFRLFQSAYVLSFILLIILYCLKVRLPMTYRVLSGLQAMSCILYSKVIYLEYEDFFVLRYFNLLSGPFQIDYRLQSLSTNHAIQSYVLFGFFIFLLFVLYYPSQTFYKKSDSFWEYLKQNILEYFENFYYFGGKMMFLYIGMFIQSTQKQLTLIIHMVIFSLLIVVVFVRLIMEYHNNNLSEEIYQGPLYVYSMLANAALIGIPLIEQSTILIILYASPLGLLILIAILNKDIKIIDKNSIKFFVVEIIMAGLCVGVILFDGQIRTYILLITLSLCIMLIVVQVSLTYYGGIDLSTQNQGKRSNKIQPVLNDSLNEVEMQSKKSIQLDAFDQNKKKGKYF